jgi:transposase
MQLTIDLGDEDGGLVSHRQVSTKPAVVTKFLQNLAEASEPHGGFMAIVEVCGFNDWLLKMLKEVGCRETVLAQPDGRSKQKTDRRDARQLRESLWNARHRLARGQRPPGLRRVRIVAPEMAADRQLTQLRIRTTELRTRAINRIHGLLKKHNLQHAMPTKGIQTRKALAWLKTLELPEMDRLEMDLQIERWELLDRQLARIDQQIKARHQADEDAQVVSTLPGLSRHAGVAVAAHVVNVDDFAHGDSLANFLGLTPGCRNSGETRRLGSITKQGSSTVRYLLGQAVVHVLRKDAWMRQWYTRIKRRRGASIARVAVMRRLATILWAMLKYRIPYVCGGPEELRKQVEFAKSMAASNS